MNKKTWAIFLTLLSATGQAAAAAVVVATVTSSLGFDPVLWAIGAAGGTVVYAYRKPTTRAIALANGLICIFLGGIVSPWANKIVTLQLGEVWSNEYILAGVLSAAWPWLAPAALEKIRLLIGVTGKEQ
jgi:hypothetical protein